MKNIYLLLFALFLFASVKAQQTIAICKEKQGCEIVNINLSRIEVDKLLGKQNFLTAAPKNAILVLDDCKSTIELKRTTVQIHQSFGGKGTPKISNVFNLKNYLVDKGCLKKIVVDSRSLKKCPNPTQKISFSVTSSRSNLSSFFYLNINASEAYMPNEAYQTLMDKDEGGDGSQYDSVLKGEKSTMYAISAEGKKYKIPSAFGATGYLPGSSKDDYYWEKVFKMLKPTGQKKYFLSTKEFVYEYSGNIGGLPLKIWLYSSNNVCLPMGKPTALGFYNIGYFAAYGKTYLIAETTVIGNTTKVTGLTNASYSFNPIGYEAIGTQ